MTVAEIAARYAQTLPRTRAALLTAADLIIEMGHCQHREAANSRDVSCRPVDANACRWSVSGAVAAAIAATPECDLADEGYCLQLVRQLAGWARLEEWNDRNYRVKSDVVRVLFDAACNAGAYGPPALKEAV